MVETYTIFQIRQWQEGENTYTYNFTDNPNGHQMARLSLDGEEQDTVGGRTITWSIDRSQDGVIWVPMIETTFVTGAPGRYPRSLKTSIDGIVGQLIRLRIDQAGGRLRYGATLQLGLMGEI